VDVHGDLAAVAYVCPSCVTALWVDVEPAAGKTWRDFAVRG
jgi:N-methylhydantoinase B